MKTIMCLGKFDVLHTGHLYHLKEAKAQGDRLVVVITADAFLPDPPVFNQGIRMQTLEMLPWVDEVYICDDDTGIPAIHIYKPNILVKGSDYSRKDRVLQLETTAVESHGGKVVILNPEITYSSTKLEHRYGPFVDLQHLKYTLHDVKQFLDDVSSLIVSVIGEPIIDVFQTVQLLGQSPKSYCPSFGSINDPVEYEGGALYVKRHIQNLCRTCYGYPPKSQLSVHKLRYLDNFNHKKHFEIKYGGEIKIRTIEFNRQLKALIQEAHLTLVADFGHGFFDNQDLVDGLYLMVQTNSTNFGYNKVDKWNRYKSKLVCLDRTEASLLLGQELDTAGLGTMKRIFEHLNTEAVILTMHKYGSIYYDQKNRYAEFPSLATQIVDSIGAGDAFFAIASLAYHLEYEPEKILLLASLSSAANTQHLCTKDALTPKKLLKVSKAIL